MVRSSGRHVIGAFDAKTVFEQLLNRVENGGTIVITRHGAPVAKLVPCEEPIDVEVVDQAIREIETLRKGNKLRGVSLRALIRRGRRR